MKWSLLLTVTTLSTMMQSEATISQRICVSPQYLEMSQVGMINCLLPEEYFTVLWYTAAGFENNTPTLQYQGFAKTGPGYDSGEFDIFANGSLIIMNVTFKHDTTFTVAYTRSKEERFLVTDIQIVVTVKPHVTFPVIDKCNDSNNCYTESDGTAMQCTVRRARPNVTLSFIARSVDGDRIITNDTMTMPEGLGYTTVVTTSNVFLYSPLLVLLVCTASSSPGLLKHNYSTVLVENSNKDISHVKAESIYIKRDTTLKLNCSNQNIGYFVWKKSNPPNYEELEILLHSVFIGGEFTQILADDVVLGDNSSLVIYSTKVKHEGKYMCISGDGRTNGVAVYNVTMIVPAYPQIDGCNHQQYCILEAQNEGILKCTVDGIYPQVQLRWKTFNDDDSTLISFTNPQLEITREGETFNLALVSEYRVRDRSHDRLTLECEVVASQEDLLDLTMKMDLLFVKGNIHPTDKISISLLWVIPVIVASCVILVIGTGFTLYVRKHNSKTKEVASVEEMTSMLGKNQHEAEVPPDKQTFLKQKFLKQLQEKYKDLYDAVQPIPYIKDKLFCVDKVFVEGGITYLDSRGGAKDQWTSLDTYQNVFDDSRVISPRRILEGEPGYGKSAVTLQFAYDWCNSISTSPLKDVEILVLLRLRQLGGVESIYKAIKQFILPKDSRLSESDIEHILQDSNSVVVILDGFDEYPDQDSITSDIISIIARQMFQDFEVVLTTRSSFLPKKYPPLTKRLRLTGFDENARRYYIRKAVVGDNNEDSVSKIEGYLEENPILSDLCQVPLLFVIFAHMTYESENFRKLNSATSFFRYMISCFHSHMRNKMNDKNVRKYELFETGHQNLDKLAFKALSGESQRIVWNKDEMCQLVGQEFYEQYIRIGILVEEESVDIIDDPHAPTTGDVQYKTEVRFYHKLFCEWYAAHYLVDHIEQNPNLDLSSYLQHLDPFDVQYLYRFSCGLNSTSSEKIINYLKNIEGGDKFEILCILEQAGKIDNIKDTIRRLCSEGLIISVYDTLLLQRSSIQLLEIAARNDVPIELVHLYHCLDSVDNSKEILRITSGLSLSSKIPVRKLVVCLPQDEMAKDTFNSILRFSSICSALEELVFCGNVPPQSVEVDKVLTILSSRTVTVKHRKMLEGDKKVFIYLNLQTGRWQGKDGNQCNEADFEQMKLDWDKIRNWPEEDIKADIKRGREELRNAALRKQQYSSGERE